MAKIEINTKAMVAIMTQMVMKEAESYGPVYPRIVAKNVCEFLAKMINDQSPPKVNTLEEAVSYIMKNLVQYPNGLGAIVYGTTLAQNALEGSIGAISKPTYDEATKQVSAKNNGALVDTSEAYRKQVENLKAMHMIGSNQSVSGDGEFALVKSEDCMFTDACKAIMKLGIRSRTGAFQCPIGRSGAVSVQMATGIPHDYELVDFKPPDCTFKIFKA